MAKRKAKKAKTKPAPQKKTPKKKKVARKAASKAAAPSAAKTKGKKKTKAGKVGGKKAKASKPATVKSKPAAKKKTTRPAAAKAAKPASKPAIKKSAKSASPGKSGGTLLMIPPPLLNSDFLPLWFGGDGLTECFKTMGVATIGELRQKTEEDVLAAAGTSALVRIKARIERIEERALAPKMEPPALGAAPPMSETFAYFLKPSVAEHSMLGTAPSRSQICDIVLRPSSTQVTVRLCGGAMGGWRDVTVPLDQLELVSRDHRREELEDASEGELNELAGIYKLKGLDPVTRIDSILDYEFSAFGREW
jgi:hypothetical protein